jgi:WhiB family redox-sensing transcriptional regulator
MNIERLYMKLAKAVEESPIVPPCMNTDPELWFGDADEGYYYHRQAKKFCQMCPAKKACAEYAIWAPELHGVWGGLLPRERQAIRNKKAA